MATAMVLGAGMVGTASALALQARGHDVVLIDRRGPGEETSHGNAGVIQTEAAEPYAMPRSVGALARIALRRTDDVHWQMSALPRLAGPLWSYFRNSAAARHGAAAEVYSRLTARAAADHAPLIAAAGADDLVRRNGFLFAFRSEAALQAAARDAERVGRAFDVPATVLSGDAVTRAVPSLVRRLPGAIHWTGSWSCRDPGGLVRAYARLFRERGGRVVTGDAATLAAAGAGWSCRAADGPLSAEHAVVALGPWSPTLLARFGYRAPMVPKRGYHRHFACADAPDLPVFDAERATMLSPMAAGLRVATGAELAPLDAPGRSPQMRRAEAAARELLALGAPLEAEPWHGTRPCMPDMLPVVGAAPRHRGLWLHFGHGHQGFTLGPTTAAILADLVGGGLPDEAAGRLGWRF